MEATLEKLEQMLGEFPTIHYKDHAGCPRDLHNPELWSQLRHALALERQAEAQNSVSARRRH